MPSLSSNDANVNTSIDTKDSNGAKFCGKCNEIVNDESKAVCCDCCSLWFHVKCEGITDTIYRCLNVGGDHVHWYCRSWNNKALDIMELIQGLKEEIYIFEVRIDSFTCQVENLALVNDCFAEKLREMINEEVDEIKEEKIRRCNVILSNIPEQTGHENNVETTVTVTDVVNVFIHSVLGAEDIKIISANRVPSSRMYGWSNSSNHKIMVKL